MVNGRPKIDFRQKYWHWWTVLEHFQWSVLWNDFANTLQIITRSIDVAKVVASLQSLHLLLPVYRSLFQWKRELENKQRIKICTSLYIQLYHKLLLSFVLLLLTADHTAEVIANYRINTIIANYQMTPTSWHTSLCILCKKSLPRHLESRYWATI